MSDLRGVHAVEGKRHVIVEGEDLWSSAQRYVDGWHLSALDMWDGEGYHHALSAHQLDPEGAVGQPQVHRVARQREGDGVHLGELSP